MTKPTRPPLSDQERAERRRRDRELMQQAVEALRSSAGWRNWLRVRSNTGLARYSLLLLGRGCHRGVGTRIAHR